MIDKKYEEDFPATGSLNWKKVKLKNAGLYYNGNEIIGVVLHDNKFMVNGVLFTEDQYDIVDDNPMKLE